jgi:hypothetical protein
MKLKLLTVTLCCISLMLAGASALAQNKDFGDAPDPAYPSLNASGGPAHTDLTDSYVGFTSTAEADALVPDLDADDGAPVIFASNAPGMWTGWVYVPVTLSPTAPNIPRYLNVDLDIDADGTWCNVPGEWVVRNYTVYWLPGQTIYYCIGGFTSVTDFSGNHWIRITVSDSPITANVANGWDGSWPPGFQRGETEDWLLSWHYSPHGPVPPNDPGNPPAPAPLPECNKSATVYQSPPPTHHGHSGTFQICVKNDGTHPIHITEGPFVTGPWGDPISIPVDGDLVSTNLEPGDVACVNAGWSFSNPAPNKAWCDFEAVWDPQGQTVIGGNVGDYSSPTSTECTGGTFEEDAVSSVTGLGTILLVLALLALSLYLVLRKRTFAKAST